MKKHKRSHTEETLWGGCRGWRGRGGVERGGGRWVDKQTGQSKYFFMCNILFIYSKAFAILVVNLLLYLK